MSSTLLASCASPCSASRRQTPSSYAPLLVIKDVSSSKWACQVEDVSDRFPRRRVLCRSSVFRLASHPGFLFATSPFTPEQQRAWCSRALLGYLTDANVSNTHELYGPVLDGLWQRACAGDRIRVRRRATTAGGAVACERARKRSAGAGGRGGDAASGHAAAEGRAQDVAASAVLGKVRWVTLGHHYDWTLRQYPPGAVTPFPRDAAALAEGIAAELGWPLRAEAAIFNLYRPSSAMGGHRDDLEATFAHPVVSVSFGLPALFLLGGADKSAEPVPILVRSGDVLVLSGEARLAVHAVPVVFSHSCPPWLSAGAPPRAAPATEAAEAPELWPDESCWPDGLSRDQHERGLGEFMARTRLNLNVRQVWE